MVDGPVVTSCPFCGGTIRAAAKLCKHCRKQVPAVARAPQDRSAERPASTAGDDVGLAGSSRPQPAGPDRGLKRSWEVLRDGKLFGPYDGASLRASVAEGRVRAADTVRADGVGLWVPAEQVPELADCFPPPGRARATAVRRDDAATPREDEQVSLRNVHEVPAAERASVVPALRAYLTGRGIVSQENFDFVCGTRTGTAAAALASLRAAGHLTAVQVETVSEAFQAVQAAWLRSIVEAARERGLLRQRDVDAAVEGFAPVAMERDVAQYLVAGGLLTAAQVADLSRQVGTTQRAVPAVSRTTIAIPPTRASAAQRWPIVAIIGAVAGVPLVFIAANLLGHSAASTNAPPTLHPDCSLTRDDGMFLGYGVCRYANNTRVAVNACGVVHLTCDGTGMQTAPMCSGVVLPDQVRSVDVFMDDFARVAFGYDNNVRLMREHCVWRWDPMSEAAVADAVRAAHPHALPRRGAR